MQFARSLAARVPRTAKVAVVGAGAAGFALAQSAPLPQAATIASLLGDIGSRLDRIETTLGIGKDYSKELAMIADVKATQPDNIGIQCFDFAYFESLSPELQDRMIACARSGFENPDSGMGAYAIQVRATHPPLDLLHLHRSPGSATRAAHVATSPKNGLGPRCRGGVNLPVPPLYLTKHAADPCASASALVFATAGRLRRPDPVP